MDRESRREAAPPVVVDGVDHELGLVERVTVLVGIGVGAGVYRRRRRRGRSRRAAADVERNL